MRFVSVFTFAVLSLAAVSSVLHAADRDTLKGISGVAVVIEDIPDSALADGLSSEKLKAFVEQKLSGAGIAVLDERKWFSVFGGSYLLVEIIASKYTDGASYALFIDTELHQTVVLFGKKLGQNINTAASTWSAGKLISCRTEELLQCTARNLDGLINLFIEDYIVVNTPGNDEKEQQAR